MWNSRYLIEELPQLMTRIFIGNVESAEDG
jgi:hypothetical protein